jgi:hypothetical protein
MGSQIVRAILLVLIFTSTCFAETSLKVHEGTFDNFLMEVVAQEDQKEFARFYADLVRGQQKKKLVGKEKDLKKIQQNVANFQEQGRIAIQVKNPVLAADAKKTLCSKHLDKAQERKIKTLWYRFGVYEEFLQQKAAKQKSILTKTKSYMRDAGNKVISWVSTLKGSRVTT